MKRPAFFFIISIIVLFQQSANAQTNDIRTVFIAQIILNHHGYNAGDPDGVAGPATLAALQEFSSYNSIEPTFPALYSFALSKNISQRQEITDNDYMLSIEKSVASNLRNPESARFRDIYSIKGPSFGDQETTYVCGNVNGHNAYGGYAGFKWFYGTDINANSSRFFLFSGIGEEESDLAEMICTMTFSGG